MDLIVNIASWVLAFIASVLGNILAHDICTSADRTCTKIVCAAARRLAPFDRESGEQEWLADLHERETVREKYQHAFGCYLVAGKMRRHAETITVQLRFEIAGVGTVPLSINPSSKLAQLSFAAGNSRFHRIKSANAIILILYIGYKFAKSTQKLGPGKLRKLFESLNDYRNWGYSASLQRKGLDIKLDKLFRAMVLNPDGAPALLRKLTETLKAAPQSTPPC
jgi:hypothetical protein